jgi:Protein phosphatase 2C
MDNNTMLVVYQDTLETSTISETLSTATPVTESSSDEDDSGDISDEEVVGVEEASKLDRDMMLEDDQEEIADHIESMEEEPAQPTTTAEKMSVIFQRFFHIPTTATKGVLRLDTSKEGTVVSSPSSEQSPSGPSPEQSPSSNVNSDGSLGHEDTRHNSSGPLGNPASSFLNGRFVCNLPDHPVHAGATAVVAVLVGRTVTVANAGDSRAVLSRNGVAIPLSFDHKPHSVEETNRIKFAGGFINHFGRVNGNLNLSRSIGDLKYKSVPGLTPAQQMITAQPDIIQYVSFARAVGTSTTALTLLV